MLKKFAEELKEQRIKQGVTLQDIHINSKVDIKYLEAIENGNFDLMPDVYMRAFIKSYAANVGLDPQATLNKYDAYRSGKIVEEKTEEKTEENIEVEKPKQGKPATKVTSFTSEPAPQDYHEQSTSRRKNSTLLIIISFAAICVIIVLYLFVFRGSSNEIITERPYEQIIEENKKRFEAEDEQNMSDTTIVDSTYAAVPTDSLRLVIRAAGTSWFLIRTDNEQSGKDFILYSGSSKLIKAARNYSITIGNSGKVKFILNDKQLNFIGKEGEVKNIKIDSTGLSYVQTTKPVQNINEH